MLLLLGTCWLFVSRAHATRVKIQLQSPAVRHHATGASGAFPAAATVRRKLRRSHRLARGENCAPVDDRVPQHALIAAIEIAMQRIEVESDDMTRS